MECPRCKSTRIQRGYKDSSLLSRLAQRHELLCNNCGLEFRGFDVFGRFIRAPANVGRSVNRRREPRFGAHLPATISLGHREPGSDKLTFSPPTRGHCETISKLGLEVSFVGQRFRPEDFAEPGCILLVSIVLPNGPVDAVVETVSHTRQQKERGLSSWLIGATINQMSDADRERLDVYIEKRAEGTLPLDSI